MRRLLLVGTMVATLSGTAEALTIRDIIELTRAGIGEDVLLALIEVDRGVYAIDTPTLKQLKAAGVSDRVLVALVRSGRERVESPEPLPVIEDPDPPAPQVVVIEHHDPVERVREVPVAVAVPVYIPVATRRRHRPTDGIHDASSFLPFQSGPSVGRPVTPHKAEPVYWGWGGKLRPDAWQPTPAPGHDPKDVRQRDRRK